MVLFNLFWGRQNAVKDKLPARRDFQTLFSFMSWALSDTHTVSFWIILLNPIQLCLWIMLPHLYCNANKLSSNRTMDIWRTQYDYFSIGYFLSIIKLIIMINSASNHYMVVNHLHISNWCVKGTVGMFLIISFCLYLKSLLHPNTNSKWF